MLVFPIYFLRSSPMCRARRRDLLARRRARGGAGSADDARDRVDAFDVRKPLRRMLGMPELRVKAPEEQFWYRAAQFAMRRAVPVVVVVVAVIACFSVHPCSVSGSAIPTIECCRSPASSRQVGEILREQFSAGQLGGSHRFPGRISDRRRR